MPIPELSSTDSVIIEVHFSGLNFADVMMRLNLYPDAPKAPFSPGYEVSGTILAVGDAVHDFKVGDAVMAGCYFGGYCSHICLPSWQVRKIPPAFSLEQAAGFMVSYLTAAFGLFELARVRPSDHVVIDCASGALGAVMIKLLQKQGVSQITGLTRSEDKFSAITDLSVEALTHQQWRESKRKADVFINSRGGSSIATNLDQLAPLGRVVCLGASSLVHKNKVNLFRLLKEFVVMEVLGRPSVVKLMNENRGVFGLNVLSLFDCPEKIQELLSEKYFIPVVPKIDQIFSYQDVIAAHEKLGSGRSSGKILLSWK